MTTAEDLEVLLPARTQVELMTAQVEAIDAWNQAQRSEDDAAEGVPLTRELRLDLARRTEARRREQQAVHARAEQQLRESGGVLGDRARTRAVLAHRNAWLRDSVAARLEEHGVAVVGVFDDGADAVGTVVVEQPDLVLVEDRLPTLSGIDVVRRVRRFAPQAVVGVQCLDGDGIRALADAGAQAVFTRRVTPLDIADQLLRCLVGEVDPVAAG
jgi:CheY-like chemotaxis protein